MKPEGRRPIRFPGKTQSTSGARRRLGWYDWWEDHVESAKAKRSWWGMILRKGNTDGD